MNKRLIIVGLIIWAAATLALRLAGQYVIHPVVQSGSWVGPLILFAVSFALMAWVVRRLCGGLPRDQKLAGAVSVALPTLLLDPFSCAFFPFVFPNMRPEAAGVFGGWIIICCAGALLGVLER